MTALRLALFVFLLTAAVDVPTSLLAHQLYICKYIYMYLFFYVAKHKRLEFYD